VTRRRGGEVGQNAGRGRYREALSIAEREALEPFLRKVGHAAIHEAERAEAGQDQCGRLDELEPSDDLQAGVAWQIVLV
jgi:hypothetical protein